MRERRPREAGSLPSVFLQSLLSSAQAWFPHCPTRLSHCHLSLVIGASAGIHMTAPSDRPDPLAHRPCYPRTGCPAIPIYLARDLTRGKGSQLQTMDEWPQRNCFSVFSEIKFRHYCYLLGTRRVRPTVSTDLKAQVISGPGVCSYFFCLGLACPFHSSHRPLSSLHRLVPPRWTPLRQGASCSSFSR
jgi:hypothetical protein